MAHPVCRPLGAERSAPSQQPGEGGLSRVPTQAS